MISSSPPAPLYHSAHLHQTFHHCLHRRATVTRFPHCLRACELLAGRLRSRFADTNLDTGQTKAARCACAYKPLVHYHTSHTHTMPLAHAFHFHILHGPSFACHYLHHERMREDIFLTFCHLRASLTSPTGPVILIYLPPHALRYYWLYHAVLLFYRASASFVEWMVLLLDSARVARVFCTICALLPAFAFYPGFTWLRTPRERRSAARRPDGIHLIDETFWIRILTPCIHWDKRLSDPTRLPPPLSWLSVPAGFAELPATYHSFARHPPCPSQRCYHRLRTACHASCARIGENSKLWNKRQ